MISTFDLRTLGALALSATGPGPDPAPVLRQPKRAGLLLYLLLHEGGTLQYRERVISVFWPNQDHVHGRGALRQALSFLDGSLGEGVLTRGGRDRVGVAADRFRCDAVRFDALLSEGEEERALELYRGDFLEGFKFLDVSGAFHEWMDARRSSYRSRASEAAWTLASRAEAEGRTAQAAFWGKRAVDIGPFSEPQAQRLMQLLHRVGDRAGALRVYSGLEEALRRAHTEPARSSWELACLIRALPEEGGFSGRRASPDRRSSPDRRVEAEGYVGPERRARERRSGRLRRVQEDRRRGV